MSSVVLNSVDILSFLAKKLQPKLTVEFQNESLNLINTKRRSELSKNGHKLDELLSALQKYCRQGELQKAIYVVIEFEGFSNVLTGNAIYTNFLNRMRVILIEDISLANPLAVIRFNHFYEIVENARSPTTIEYQNGKRDSEENRNKRLIGKYFYCYTIKI